MSGVTSPARPTAATRMSARRVCSARSTVREWQIVTVACSARSSIAIGLPTISLRPITTASLPFSSTPCSASITITPDGVAGTRKGSPRKRSPALDGWKPSTSLSGSTARSTFGSSMCSGSGSWTRIPSTPSSAFRSAMSSRISTSSVSAGKRWSRDSMPASCEALCFEPTYVWEAGSSPTRMVARHTGPPKARTSSATSARTLSASSFPSIRTAAIDRKPYFFTQSRTLGAWARRPTTNVERLERRARDARAAIQ